MLWVAYFVIHSLLASEFIKDKLGNPSWYRGFYVLVSIIMFIPIILFRVKMDTQFLFEVGVYSKIPAVGLGYAAFYIFKQAAKEYDLKAFIGLRKEQVNLLKTEGILARVRHPFYTGTIALALGFLIWTPTLSNLIMVIVWFAYLPIGIWLEEKKLINEFGDAYLQYKRKVPSVFPKFFK